MISGGDLYTVLSAMAPLYAAMLAAYASVRWWKIFTPVQCSGINRFVAVFAVPLLSFHFIATNNPYKMDTYIILADTIAKLLILALLAAWARLSETGSLDWLITLFAVATLPNTLVMGIPLLAAMYGSYYGEVMVQLVVLQCIIWYTLLLFLFEYRAARLLLLEQFPGGAAAEIVSVSVDPDIISLDGAASRDVETLADVGDDGKIRLTIRRSASSRRHFDLLNLTSSAAFTPRPSNMTGVEIYSVYSSRNNTPRDSILYHHHHHHHPNPNPNPNPNLLLSTPVLSSPRRSYAAASDAQSSRGPTPRPSSFTEDAADSLTRDSAASSAAAAAAASARIIHSSVVAKPAAAGRSAAGPATLTHQHPSHHTVNNYHRRHLHAASMAVDMPAAAAALSKLRMQPPPPPPPPPIVAAGSSSLQDADLPHYFHGNEPIAYSPRLDDDGKELHMFVWSSTASPVSPAALAAAEKLHSNAAAAAAAASVADSVSPRGQSSAYNYGLHRMTELPHINNNTNSNVNAAVLATDHHFNIKEGGVDIMREPILATAAKRAAEGGEDFSFEKSRGTKGAEAAAQLERASTLIMGGGGGGAFPAAPPPIVTATRRKVGGEAAAALSSAGGGGGRKAAAAAEMPAASVMGKLILRMVARKLLHNPNTYSSVVGLAWSLIAFRWNIAMPKIIVNSISILSDAGLGMAMFSLGLFMALQPRLIACGIPLATFAMAVRFLTGPAVMAACSIAVGLRGVHLHAAIVQAALPQGIVPFVFAREYDLHPDILSTAVIFGMLVALPTTLLYYILLGL